MSVGPNRILGDKYRLIRPLDAGGVGSVWLAEHLSLAAPVAVKLIQSPVLSESRLARFTREARAAAAARSPHVVQMLDYGVDAGTPFIVMELLDGESLAARLGKLGRLEPEQTEDIVRQVSRALSRAHDAGIVHRDLKPSSIFIARNEDAEVVKLLDFGISRDMADDAGVLRPARTTSLQGSPSYMSPEQLEGSPLCDHRTDVWALGVIAFECLLGRVPFAGKGIGGLVLGICSGPMPVPSEHGSVPPGFDAWFARACARSLDERFESAREAAAAMRQLIDPTPDEPAPREQPVLREAMLDASVLREPVLREPVLREPVLHEPVLHEPGGTERPGAHEAGPEGALDAGDWLAPVPPAPAAPHAAPSRPEWPTPPPSARPPDVLPTTTAPPSSATFERRPERPRTRPIWLLAPLVLSVLAALLLRSWRAPEPATSSQVLQPLSAAAPLPVVPPPAEPAPATAGLAVSGEGDDLQLSIDGTQVGPLPRTLHDLTPGEHSLHVSGGPRYRPYTARVQLAAGQLTEVGPVQLEVAKGLATVVAGENAAGAKVVLQLGDEELALPPLPVQLEVDTAVPHTLLARRRGYTSYSEPLSFEPGRSDKTFSVSLDPLPSKARAAKQKRARRVRSGAARAAAAESAAAPPTFSFRSTPQASVLLDGMPMGTTPLHDVPVSPGSHRVIFIHGDQRKAMVVTGNAGKNRVVSARFRVSGAER